MSANCKSRQESATERREGVSGTTENKSNQPTNRPTDQPWTENQGRSLVSQSERRTDSGRRQSADVYLAVRCCSSDL